MKQTILPTTLKLFALCIIAILASCDKEQVKYTFPHDVHYEFEISCDSCHYLEDEGITNPTFDSCLTCHEPDAETFASCNDCHNQAGVEVKDESIVSHSELFAKYLPDNWEDVEFQHQEYLEGDPEECMGCHSAVKETSHSTLENLPSMETSMAYNEEHGISNECEVCHTKLTEFTKPSSHDSFWPEKHGKMMEFQDRDSCLMCHQEDTCQVCHQTQKPRNHNNLFRRRTHGIQAAFDRSSCLECHRNDECEVCHRASADPIPAANFHNPDAPCLACHSPQGAPRPDNRFLKPMPHRMMMGMSASKCLECHTF